MPVGRLIFDGDNRYTEKEARVHKLTDEVEEKINKIPNVIDNVTSDSSTDALSAKMGKVLQDQIDNLSGINKFLSGWNCTTGLPDTNPAVNPYVYEAGDYYIISTVAAEGGTNIKPHGATYNAGVPSTAIETEDVKVGDWYIYDGMQWVLQITTSREIVIDEGLSPTSTNPVENRAVYNALTTKQNSILDLNTIREGAALGATSIQPGDNISELTNNAGFQTAGDVASSIQDAIEQLAPTGVGTGVLTLQKNSTTIDTFSANAAQDKTINITVPTTVAELSDASDYATKQYVNDKDTAMKNYVDGEVSTINTTIGNIQGDITNIQGDITDIQGDITNINSDITNIQGDITDIQGDITNIEGDITNIQGDITNIEGDITNIQGDITNIEGDITTINTSITTIEQLVGDGVSNEPYSQNWSGVTTTAPSKNALYNKIENIEDQIEDITTGGASTDHLELAAVVGELYTANSDMFLQDTPTYANATGYQNVGQDAANTEVHIQRIGSGNATGSLKLKLRMVGESSIDLKVEVRAGTYQTVSATEAWWYGNPNQILATGTIAHNQITTSWAEYTVSLDNLVGGARGQLLDVVVYQAGRVINTTNYYQVAYDESQYTEAYRIITYNGSAYTRTDKAGYCVSNAFESKLLCKVGETQETTMTATTISGSSGWADNYSTTNPTINFTATDTTGVSGMGKYIVYINCREVNHTSGCFLEGAKVTMADGSIKNVEDVEVGDMVLSYNVETGEYVPAKVTIMLSHIFCINDINKITMGNDVLDIAGIHPVYALAKGSEELAYIPANKLELGDKVFTNGGELKEITELYQYKYIDRLFNFAVEGTHNCFVEGCLTVFE